MEAIKNFSHHLCFFNDIDALPGHCNTIHKDAYTAEVTGPDAVRVLVATKAKPSQDIDNPLDREFFKSFLDVSPIKCDFFLQ